MSSRDAASWQAAPALPPTHFVSGAVYTDPDVFADERRQIFEKVWHLACHESELPAPFDFRTMDYVGHPLLIVRGGDGEIRTFLNVCSHRGAKLVNGTAGNAKRFTCFYHLWSYDDRGACIDIPRPEGYAAVGLDKEACGLRRVRTETYLGLVFVCLDDGAPPLRDYLGSALEPFEAVMGSGQLEIFHYNRGTLDANWKAWQETNLDLYHEWMHVLLRRTQISAAGMTTRTIRAFANGHTAGGGLKANYTGYEGMAGRSADKALPGLAPDDFFFVDLWPNASLLARGTTIRIDTVTPIDARHAVVEWRGLGLKGDSPEDRRMRMRHHNEYWGPFGRNVPEDAFAVEACEKSFAGGSARFQIVAREEAMSGQDDGMLRAWYAEWQRRLGRPASEPTNRRA